MSLVIVHGCALRTWSPLTDLAAVAFSFEKDGGLFEAKADVDSDGDEQNAHEEGHAPTPGLERGLAKETAQNDQGDVGQDLA